MNITNINLQTLSSEEYNGWKPDYCFFCAQEDARFWCEDVKVVMGNRCYIGEHHGGRNRRLSHAFHDHLHTSVDQSQIFSHYHQTVTFYEFMRKDVVRIPLWFTFSTFPFPDDDIPSSRKRPWKEELLPVILLCSVGLGLLLVLGTVENVALLASSLTEGLPCTCKVIPTHSRGKKKIYFCTLGNEFV